MGDDDGVKVFSKNSKNVQLEILPVCAGMEVTRRNGSLDDGEPSKVEVSHRQTLSSELESNHFPSCDQSKLEIFFSCLV